MNASYTYTFDDIRNRPVAVIGAGTLGRRIALMFASRGGTVRIYARRDEQLAAIKAQYLKKGTVEKIAHRTDVSDVKDFGIATTKEKPRRNLAKRSSSVGMGKR